MRRAALLCLLVCASGDAAAHPGPNGGFHTAAPPPGAFAGPGRPSIIEPASVEPASVEPAPVEPAPVEPAPVEPAPRAAPASPWSHVGRGLLRMLLIPVGIVTLAGIVGRGREGDARFEQTDTSRRN